MGLAAQGEDVVVPHVLVHTDYADIASTNVKKYAGHSTCACQYHA